MAGISFTCGSFRGPEKTGSAITGVMDHLECAPLDLIQEVKEVAGRGYGFITEQHARALLPHLLDYRARLVADIGHDDWTKEDKSEVAAGLDPVRAKWGAGRGWRLLCTTDLIRACETSLAEGQPITVLLW